MANQLASRAVSLALTEELLPDADLTLRKAIGQLLLGHREKLTLVLAHE